MSICISLFNRVNRSMKLPRSCMLLQMVNKGSLVLKLYAQLRGCPDQTAHGTVKRVVAAQAETVKAALGLHVMPKQHA